MIKALEANRGIVTKACALVDIARQTHYRWLSEDPEYKAACEEVGETAIDSVEGKLYDLIDKGDTTATIFYLKTKGKKRGYIEKQEIEHTGEMHVSWNETKTYKPDGQQEA